MISNVQKYKNYKEQIGRLNKAIKNGFYIEAVAIEYAIIEDRLESVLVHEKVFNPEKHGSLARKLRRIKELQRRRGSLENKYLTIELLNESGYIPRPSGAFKLDERSELGLIPRSRSEASAGRHLRALPRGVSFVKVPLGSLT